MNNLRKSQICLFKGRKPRDQQSYLTTRATELLDNKLNPVECSHFLKQLMKNKRISASTSF